MRQVPWQVFPKSVQRRKTVFQLADESTDPGHVSSGCGQDSCASYAGRGTVNALTMSTRQLQTGKEVGEEAYNSMVDCFRKIIRNEGYVIIVEISQQH